MAASKAPIVIAGAGLHGSALAYYLTKRGEKPILLEQHAVAAAASGKGGGFLARDWGEGSVTNQLHKVSFALHEELAAELGLTSYRRIPVLSISPGEKTKSTRTDLCPGWLDGDFAQARVMDADGGAQVAPLELCTKLADAAIANGATLRIGKVEGIRTRPPAVALAATDAAPEGVTAGMRTRSATAAAAGGTSSSESEPPREVCAVVVDGEEIECSAFVVTMGPWACLAQDWFDMPVPMTGIKSTSVIFRAPEGVQVEPVALFCGEDDRFGTHLEVYPRSSGEVYLCGIGGSEYVTDDELRAGVYPPGEVHADASRVSAAAASFSTMSKRLGKPAPDTTQACMRPCPPDALPLMGKIPHIRNAYMSAGHNCWGILWSPVSGKAMSELILDGRASCVDLSAFSPGRFMAKAKAGTRGRKKGAAAVGEQW